MFSLGTGETDFGDFFAQISAQIFTVVAWDPPGYGKSSSCERQWGLEMLAVDADVALALMQVNPPPAIETKFCIFDF